MRSRYQTVPVAKSIVVVTDNIAGTDGVAYWMIFPFPFPFLVIFTTPVSFSLLFFNVDVILEDAPYGP